MILNAVADMRSRMTRYLAGLVLLALAVIVRAAIDPWLGPTLSHPTVFTAVLLTTWYFGEGPAILSALVGYPVVELLVLDNPVDQWHLRYLIPSLGLYLGLNVIIIAFVTRFRQERDRLQRAEVTLRDSEQRIRACFDNAALGIVETDGHDRLVAVNARMCQILGYGYEELLGMTVHDLTAPEDRSLSDDLNARLHAGLLDRLDYEKRYVSRDGSPAWVHVTVATIRDGAGQRLGSIGTVEDISERKQADEALRESELRLRLAQDAAGIGVFDWNIQTGVNVWSPQLEAMYGLPPGGFARTQPAWVELVHPDDRAEALCNVQAAFETGEQGQAEWRIVWPDGSVHWIAGLFQVFQDQAGKPLRLTGVNIDITGRKRLEHELRAAMTSTERAKEAAEDANSAKDQFLAVLSHELRTPLTPVLAAIELMQRKSTLDAESQHHLEIIHRNLELEARLIDDLLDLTRIVRGKITLDRKRIDIRAILERVVEVCRPDIEARKLHFGVEIKGAAHLINGDASRLQQVFWNVLKNAIKFTPDGGCVGIRCCQEDDHVLIEISDSGIGIEPESIVRIFNAFEQGGQRVTRQFGGLGLGLAITKRILELHDGTISAHSEGKDKGSVFRILLPQASAEAEVGAERKAAHPVPASEPTSRRILLVEDHGDTALMMHMLLKSAGYEVETAGDVQQALEIVGSREIDLLISDLGLPDRSGLDLIRELRLRGSTLKAIALSGFGREDDIRRSKEAGFAIHLTKPVDFETLIQAVKSVSCS